MEKNQIFSLIMLSLLIISLFSGCVDTPPSSNLGLIVIPSSSVDPSNNPKTKFSSFYSMDELIINSSVNQYNLPLTESVIKNFDFISNQFSLINEQISLLKNNGFVIIDYSNIDDIIQPYKSFKNSNIPIFISSDTLLHLYHIQFGNLLKSIEERELYSTIGIITDELLNQSKIAYDLYDDIDLREAARKNVAFFTIGLYFLKYSSENTTIDDVDFKIPDYVYDEVIQEIKLIEEHNGFYESPVFYYREDYSQYIPRGHYTQSDLLKRYFKTMMWYGRMSFLLKGGDPACPDCDFLITSQQSNVQTIQACLISSFLTNIEYEGSTLDELWNRIYAITSFFVGTSDDLTIYEYLNVLNDVFGQTINISSDLADSSNIFSLKVELTKLRNPQIYGGTGEIMIVKAPGEPFTLEDLNETLDKTKGFRLMGQRFIPDSYMFQQLVFPSVDPYLGSFDQDPFTLCYTQGGPARVFPRGLEVMAVLGSERALEILENEGDADYQRYHEQLEKLRFNFSSLNISEWNRNLYFSWIYTLESLINPYNENFPVFMQTDAWLEKSLNTALASWSQLRHDTILYAKQSYTPLKATAFDPPSIKQGYVEPVPLFYKRLLALTSMTKNGLISLDSINSTEISRLEFSQKELENTELSDNDYDFINDFGERLDYVVIEINDKGKQTTVIADVHTDTNTNMVLEEGVGYVDIILACYYDENNDINIAAGPVFSYYEFKHPMDDRLTDEKWVELLETNQTPERPLWIDSFYYE
jgi:hypothetical protein